MNDIEKRKTEFEKELEYWGEFITATTKIAGIARALNEISASSAKGKRYYSKTLFHAIFNQLVIHLFILTNDRNSETDLRYLGFVKRFQNLYRAKAVKLDKKIDPKIVEDELLEIKTSIDTWEHVRHNFAAHINASENNFNIPIDEISKFLEKLCKLASDMYDIIYAAELSEIKEGITVRIGKRVINLETESHDHFLDGFQWSDIK